MATFIESFKSTEEIKRKRFINILDMYKKSLENKTCMTCRHYIAKEYVNGHSYQTSECICKLKHETLDFDESNKSCNDYSVCSFYIRTMRNESNEENGGK